VVAIFFTLSVSQQKQNIKQEASNSVQDMSNLHIVGSEIVNNAGQTVLLHGVNRPSFEYSCIDGSRISEGPLDQSEISAMKSWNINAVRVTLNEDCWLGLHGMATSVSGAAYKTAVSNYVALLTQNAMAVIINLHFNGDGNSKAIEQEPMADRQNSNTFWISVADAFKNNSSVLFEPYNEPHDITWQCWRDGGTCSGVSFQAAGMQEMIQAIRGTGAKNIIIATGNNWGSDLSQWQQFKPTDPISQLAAGWHTYNDGLSCEDKTCWDTTLASVLTTNPIVATEIGEFDCNHTHIDTVMNWLDGKNQGYFAWAWTPGDCAKEPALISDWKGTPSQTFGQGFKDHLVEAALTPAITQIPSPTQVVPTNYCLGDCLPTVNPPTVTLTPSLPTSSPIPSQPTPVRNTNKGILGLLLQLLTLFFSLLSRMFGGN